MSRTSGLGKGLSALIPTGTTEGDSSTLREISVSDIRPNAYQPREDFDEEALASLTESIRALGLLQPILVREHEQGGYEIIAGERRWRASKRAGLHIIPAIVRDVGDQAALEQAIVENVQRQELNAIEEAAAYSQLIEDFGLKHEEVATRVGKSRAAISNSLRLLKLSPGVQRMVIQGELSAGHARTVLGCPDIHVQDELARLAVKQELSVRALEEEVKRRSIVQNIPMTTAPSTKLRPAGLLELEELLSDFLDTRVKIDMGSKRGRAVIEFADLADLERIVHLMKDPNQISANNF